MARKSYPSDVSDEEWALVAPYLVLLPEAAGQGRHELREVFNGLRYVVKTGAPWRWMPNDLPPWDIVYGQARRWLAAGVFAAIVHDLRVVLRLGAGRAAEPTAAVLDSRTLRSTPESGARAGYDGAKRKKGSKVHAAVDTLGHLLALHVTPATADDRGEVGRLAGAVQAATGESVEVAFVDQGYVGQRPEAAAADHGIESPAERARAIVKATAQFDDPMAVAEASRGLGEAMVGINVGDLPAPHRLAERGW